MDNSTNSPSDGLQLSGDMPVPEGQRKDAIVHDVGVRQVKDIRDFELTGYTLYTLAPIYWMVNVPFDITQEFMQNRPEARGMKLGLPRKIIDVPGWEYILEAMDTPHFEKFSNYMGEAVFQRSGQMSSVCGDYVDLPYALSGQSKVAVFTPRGLLFRFKPGVDPEGKIVLYQVSPDGRGKIGQLVDGMIEGLKYAGDTH